MEHARSQDPPAVYFVHVYHGAVLRVLRAVPRATKAPDARFGSDVFKRGKKNVNVALEKMERSMSVCGGSENASSSVPPPAIDPRGDENSTTDGADAFVPDDSTMISTVIPPPETKVCAATHPSHPPQPTVQMMLPAREPVPSKVAQGSSSSSEGLLSQLSDLFACDSYQNKVTIVAVVLLAFFTGLLVGTYRRK